MSITKTKRIRIDREAKSVKPQNTRGGKVVVGVDNNGRSSGVDVGPETEQRYLNEIKVATYPQITPRITSIKVKGKNILIFEIHEYPVKPVAYRNRYYKRVKNSTHVLSLDEIVDLKQQSLNLSSGFDGSLKRKETWRYPLEALRELLLNAVIHRDYRNTSDIVIKIFDNRIVFTNPGRLYGNLTLDLKRDDYAPAHRNRLLAEAF